MMEEEPVPLGNENLYLNLARPSAPGAGGSRAVPVPVASGPGAHFVLLPITVP